MISKTIHYCWYGQGQKGPLIDRCLKSWARVMPDYQVREWNEDNSPMDSPYVQHAYKEKAWAFLSDYVRLHALFSEGGIYLDTDVETIKPFDPLLDDKCFTGFQLQPADTDWVGTAVMGSEPGHPFIERWKGRMVALFEQTGEFHRSPAIATEVLRGMGLERYGLQYVSGVRLYPVEYFYPFTWFERFSPRRIKRDTYAIHHWAGSWTEPPPLPVQAILGLRDILDHLFQR